MACVYNDYAYLYSYPEDFLRVSTAIAVEKLEKFLCPNPRDKKHRDVCCIPGCGIILHRGLDQRISSLCPTCRPTTLSNAHRSFSHTRAHAHIHTHFSCATITVVYIDLDQGITTIIMYNDLRNIVLLLDPSLPTEFHDDITKIIFTVCTPTDYVLRSFRYTLLKQFLGCEVQRVDIFKFVSVVKEETSELLHIIEIAIE
ncbi:hypothetical protein AGLY_002838 [Aphis glycines]|uniref:Uncharacterized protein n=1 Tax=Aphis glycines TaxID=307491 RepID=A0A6G0U1T4_APHGL|nr:hypothetical protein AGLY_002838 [Aphis glycines]